MPTRRLLDESQDALMTGLLRSSRFDGPPRGSLERTAAALGVSTVAVVGTVALGTGLSGAAGAGGTAKVTVGLIAKGLLLGGLSGTLLVGGGLALSELTSEPEVGVEAPAPQPAPVPTEASIARDAAPASPAPAPASARPAAHDVLGAAPSPAPSTAAFDAVHDARLTAEVRALDGVRALLRSGRPDEALLELDRYEAAGTFGELAREAKVLRARALAAAGRQSEAAALEASLR